MPIFRHRAASRRASLAGGFPRRPWKGLASGLGLAFLAAGCVSPTYDVILRGGMILDGEGGDPVEGDVALMGNVIAAVGDVGSATAPVELDVTGLYVAPGFIDIHSHSGPGLATEGLSHGRPLLAQGLTTVVVNPDGGGPVDMERQRGELLAHGLGLNAVQLVPHGSVRRQVMGMEDRAPSSDELDAMGALVRAGMEAGAWGLSSGTFYAPGSYSENEELVGLARVAAEYDGIYTSHIRDESSYTIGVVAAVDEVIAVAREASIPGVVTHIKALGPPVWGTSETIVANIEAARAEGVEVYADQYPYLASATGLGAALLPRWSQADGNDSLQARLDDPDTRARIREAMVENLARRGGPDRIQFRRFEPDPSIEGRLLSELAEERRADALDVALGLIEQGGASIVSFNMNEDDVRRLMTREWTMTSSDGDLPEPDVGVPHPRSYGAFPRKIAHYVFDDDVMSLGAAVRSMTALPADVLGMGDRGRLQGGLVADVVVFSPDFRDNATFTEPHQLSTGVVHLFVAGRAAILSAEFTDQRAGDVLLKGRSGS